MGQNIEMNQLNMIENALQDYKGFTQGEKMYCINNLSEWISKDTSLGLMINELSLKSLDARPFLKQLGLVG